MNEKYQTIPSGYYPSVTPSDTDNLDTFDGDYPRGISIGVAGTLRVTDFAGNTVNFASGELTPGVIHPIRVQRVHADGTTATAIRVYY